MKTPRILFRCLIILAFCATSLAAATNTNLIAITAGRMVDVLAGKVLESQVILIEGDTIKEVGGSGSVLIPDGAKIIDLGNATVLPGLIDCHTHITSQPEDYYADTFRKTP